ncbi:MAG: Maf family protein [Anaerolineales bacterium]
MNDSPVLLASNSPRRRQLLALTGWKYSVAASDVDESVRPGESPEVYVRRLAEEKARAAAQKAHSERFVIGSDTTVVLDGDILGKPADADEALSMLRRLRGRTHQVFTGIAVLRLEDGLTHTDVCVTDVPMRAYSDDEIAAYVASGDPLDKAGAYAIQHAWFRPVASMAGCYASVMGLPLCHLARLMRAFGVPARDNIPSGCQTALNYACPVYASILDNAQ